MTGDHQNPTPEMLLWAYGHGVFPMADPECGRIDYYSPDPRAIIPLDAGFRIRPSLRREVRRGRFEIRSDHAFEAVIRACGGARSENNDSWIDERLITAYLGLHARGNAHSVEAWLGADLVGGLYGVHLGAGFFGESMFVRPDLGGTNGSKVCLVHLVEHLRRRGFTLLDTQFRNPHLDQFGCMEISRDAYLRRLADAVRRVAEWGPWDASDAS